MRRYPPEKCTMEDGSEKLRTELESGDRIMVDGGRLIIEEVYEDSTVECCWLPPSWPTKAEEEN